VGKQLSLIFGLLGLTSVSAVPCHAALYPYKMIPTGSVASVVAIGDLNGDGRADVAVATRSSGDPVNDRCLLVFLQTPRGTLAPPVRYPLGIDARGIAIGDLNGDGRADVAVCGGFGVAILRQQPDGTLSPAQFVPTGVDADSVAIGDLNGDGRADLAVSHSGELQVAVFYQSADGTLAEPRRYVIPHSGDDQIAIADVTGDGLADLVMLRGSDGLNNVAVFAQDPVTHLLTDPVRTGWDTDQTANGMALADFDGNGRSEVAVTWGGYQPDCGVGIFVPGADGSLQPPVQLDTSDVPEPIAAADLNGDGLTDLEVAHGGWQSLGILLRQSDGSFAPEALVPLPYAGHYEPQSLAVGDINGDGKPDIVLADPTNGLVVLYNAGDADLIPPTTAVLQGPPAYSAGDGQSFSFIGTDETTPVDGLQYSWSVDAGAWSAFSSATTATVTGLADGWHTFQVAARDAAGNVDPDPPSYPFAVDRTPPGNLALGAVNAYTASDQITVSVSAQDQIASPGELTFAWQIDGGPWSDFSSAIKITLYSLFEGTHTVEAIAKDPAGNVTPTPAAVTFTVDRTPPDTRVDSVTRHPDTGETIVRFSGTDNQPPPNHLQFSWRLDGGEWSPFTDGAQASIPSLSAGAHLFEVRARDAAGNVDPTPARRSI
jgi:hypothetical protein